VKETKNEEGSGGGGGCESNGKTNKEVNSPPVSATNIPFRRDNIECLFILSFIKSVAQNTGMLSTWLMPSLLVISQNPESFSKEKVLPSADAAVDVKKTPGGSSVIVSSFKNLIHQTAEDKYISGSSTTCLEEEEEEEVEREVIVATEQEDVDRVTALGEDTATVFCRVFKLSFEDFLHLESVKIIDKMTKTQEFIPPSFKLLISTIFRLTVQTTNFEDRHALSTRFGNGQKELVNEKVNEVSDKFTETTLISHKYESKPEYGVYYSSACATLFLRLICPALLSPLEWGVLSQKSMITYLPQKKKQQKLAALDDAIVNDNNTGEPKKSRKRDVFKRLRLGRKKDSSSLDSNQAASLTESVQKEHLAFISNMNNNPAAAAIILVAHILSNCNIEELWSSSDVELDNFQQIQSNIVRCVPIEKLNPFVEVYETEQCQSVVDPSTRSTFESAPVRKGLMGLAKDMQRLANLSIAPTDSMQSQAEGVFSRLHSNHGDEPPTSEYTNKEIDFQVEQARNIQELYDTLGETSKYVNIVPDCEVGDI